MAPEMAAGNYNQLADVWGGGATLLDFRYACDARWALHPGFVVEACGSRLLCFSGHSWDGHPVVCIPVTHHLGSSDWVVLSPPCLVSALSSCLHTHLSSIHCRRMGTRARNMTCAQMVALLSGQPVWNVTLDEDERSLFTKCLCAAEQRASAFQLLQEPLLVKARNRLAGML